MEFYSIDETRLLSSAIVSIPNGMEFYPVKDFAPAGKKSFQFPTGWNSTYALRAVAYL